MNRRQFLAGIGLSAGVGLGAMASIWYIQGSPGDLSLLEPYTAKYNYTKMKQELLTAHQDNTEYSFVVLGDNRSNMIVAPKVYGKAVSDQPAMIFNTGDLVRGGTVPEYLKSHIPLLEQSEPIPVFCVPGNHERGHRQDYAAFKKLYGDTQFSFDLGNARYVGINASEKVSVTQKDLDYLDEELSKPGADFKFVFFHVPPKYFEITFATNDRRGIGWKADKLKAILEKHGVTEVFMAHIHGYATSVIDDVRYTLTAGAGAPFSKRIPPEARIFHYMIVHVSPQQVRQELVYLKKGEWIRKEVYSISKK